MPAAIIWERRWPDSQNGWQNWHPRGAADTAVAAVDTAAAAAEDVRADYFSRRPNQEFHLRFDVAELHTIRDEGSEQVEQRIDLPNSMRRRTKKATVRG